MSTSWITQYHLTLMTFFVLVFIQAALHKGSDLRRFSGYISQYSRHFEPRAYPLAVLLLVCEIAAVALSITPATNALGEGLMLLLLVGYTLAMSLQLRSGQREIDCGCGGTPIVVSRRTLMRNATLMVLAGSMLLTANQPITSLSLALAIGGGVLLWFGYYLLEQLMHNHDLILKIAQHDQEKDV
ncbi:MauE/DoxX family redox-associated membrane protein [Vibrio furnissii]|uniref:MauE/DoxX family redox-associated membrane protein n=1 Tax=Vibrio furnissii TaxID=29494 RepID=UPI001EE9DA4C|nr:MauE/DoxX family redox-associated membrane protein [Vibrio furnissii]MCG6269734.1 methylamine utilization protein MauE [Vibrio furnissii]